MEELVLPSVIALGLGTVGVCSAWAVARGPQAVRCPEHRCPAIVRLDPKSAVLSLFTGATPHVERCSLLASDETCTRGCEAVLA